MAAPHIGPVSELLQATLAALGDETALVTGRPRGSRWVRLGDALADDAVVAGWLAPKGPTATAPERARTMFLASWLAALVVEPLARSVVRNGRGWTIHPARLHVRPTDDGWFDGLAIEGATVLVGPSDATAMTSSDVRRLPTDAAVVDAAAEEAARFGTLVLATMRRVGTIGAPAFWGSLADAIAASLVATAATAGDDVTAAFRDAGAFMDAIAREVRTGRARPDLVPVAWSHGLAHEVRRGTCCLWYQTEPEPDPAGDDYCLSCPHRDAEEQIRGWATWLEAVETERSDSASSAVATHADR